MPQKAEQEAGRSAELTPEVRSSELIRRWHSCRAGERAACLGRPSVSTAANHSTSKQLYHNIMFSNIDTDTAVHYATHTVCKVQARVYQAGSDCR